jgi:hypothetical protein
LASTAIAEVPSTLKSIIVTATIVASRIVFIFFLRLFIFNAPRAFVLRFADAPHSTMPRRMCPLYSVSEVVALKDYERSVVRTYKPCRSKNIFFAILRSKSNLVLKYLLFFCNIALQEQFGQNKAIAASKRLNTSVASFIRRLALRSI